MPHLSLFLIVPIALIRFCTHSNISKMQEKLRSSSMLPQVKRNIETVKTQLSSGSRDPSSSIRLKDYNFQEYGGVVPLATMTRQSKL